MSGANEHSERTYETGFGETLSDSFRGAADYAGRAASDGLDLLKKPEMEGFTGWLAFGAAIVGAGMVWTIGSTWVDAIKQNGFSDTVKDYAWGAGKIAIGFAGLAYAGSVAANLATGMPAGEAFAEPAKAFASLAGDAIEGVDSMLGNVLPEGVSGTSVAAGALGGGFIGNQLGGKLFGETGGVLTAIATAAFGGYIGHRLSYDDPDDKKKPAAIENAAKLEDAADEKPKADGDTADVKPADTKPADTKPADTKPPAEEPAFKPPTAVPGAGSLKM